MIGMSKKPRSAPTPTPLGNEIKRRRVKQVESIAKTQRDVISELTDSYHKAAYEDTSVDRIAEQQLLAAEYALQGLQILGIQNSQIIQLLSVQP